MAHIILKPEWHLPEARVTPEKCWRSRRDFLKQLGIAGALAAATPLSGSETKAPSKYPAK